MKIGNIEQYFCVYFLKFDKNLSKNIDKKSILITFALPKQQVLWES